jgi:hypothetical protein
LKVAVQAHSFKEVYPDGGKGTDLLKVGPFISLLWLSGDKMQIFQNYAGGVLEFSSCANENRITMLIVYARITNLAMGPGHYKGRTGLGPHWEKEVISGSRMIMGLVVLKKSSRSNLFLPAVFKYI